MFYKMTLIFLPLLLLLGVVSTYTILKDEDRDILQPFVSTSQKRRICVQLCLSGLGGTPCGEECADIAPQDLPLQSNVGNSSDSHATKNITRQSACSVLCTNNLGRPLCDCDEVNVEEVQKTNVEDFIQICSFFCMTYDYKISGCQKCSIYKASMWGNQNGKYAITRYYTKFDTTVDWPTWCLNQCSKGNGGAACNCDRLPLKY